MAPCDPAPPAAATGRAAAEEAEDDVSAATTTAPAAAAAPTEAGAAVAGTRRRQHQREVCAVCALAKARCDGYFPCQRCFRMNKPCRPKDAPMRANSTSDGSASGSSSETEALGRGKRTKRRRRCLPSTGSDGDDDEGMVEAEAGALALAVVGKEEGEEGNGVGRRQEDADAAAASPWVEVVMDRMAPKVLAESYLTAFAQLYEEGRLHREKIVVLVRFWRAFSMAIGGADPTHGICPEVERMLGITPLELEDDGLLAYAPPATVLGQRFQEESKAMAAYASGLKASQPFQFVDDGKRAIYAAVWNAVGHCAVATNAQFDALMMNALGLFNESVRRQTILALLLGSVVAPDDRVEFYRGMFTASFTRNPERITALCKLFDRQGDIMLYLCECRPTQIGAQTGAIALFEPCPASRHVTARTDTRLPISLANASAVAVAVPTEEYLAWGSACYGAKGAARMGVGVARAPLLPPRRLPAPAAAAAAAAAANNVVATAAGGLCGDGGTGQQMAAAAAVAADGGTGSTPPRRPPRPKMPRLPGLAVIPAFVPIDAKEEQHLLKLAASPSPAGVAAQILDPLGRLSSPPAPLEEEQELEEEEEEEEGPAPVAAAPVAAAAAAADPSPSCWWGPAPAVVVEEERGPQEQRGQVQAQEAFGAAVPCLSEAVLDVMFED